MADTTSLAAALLGLQRRRSDPLDQYRKFGEAVMQQGSSTAPLGSGSPLEGIARALQGGVGGYFAGQADRRQEDRNKDTVGALGDLYNAKSDEERASIIKNYRGDSDILGPIAAQLLGQKQQQEARSKAGDTFVSGYGGAPAAPQQQAAGGVPQPGYAASSAPGAFNQQALAGFESGNNPQAVNPQSGAAGTFQFMPQTWAEVRSGNPQLNLPETVAQATPQQQAQAEEAFRAQNAKALQAAGIQPTPGNLYLAHRAGAEGAKTILQAPPDTPLSTIVPPIWLQQNPDMRTTAGRFVEMANQRFPGGGAPGQAAPGAPGPVAAGPQIAQGDSLPQGAPSAASGPPEIPRPQPTAEQLQKYKALIGQGMTIPDAAAKLDAEITQQWQMDKTRQMEIWKDQQTSKRQNEKSAIELGQAAPMALIKQRMENYENKIRPAAVADVNDISSMHTVRQALDKGAFTGSGAEAKLWLTKVAEQLPFLGIKSDEAVNTQVLGAALAKRVLSAAGGSLGNQVSNSDRDLIDRAAGGTITLDEKAIRNILDVAEGEARRRLKNHDQETTRLMKMPGVGALGGDQFALPQAPTYQEWSKANPMQPTQGAPAAAAPAPQPPAASGASGAASEGATATNPQTGQKVILRGGQWVPVQ